MSKKTELDNLAVLIDAENIDPKFYHAIFTRVSTLGDASIRRIYGDFSGRRLAEWNKAVKSLGLQQHQQLASIKGGQNSTGVTLSVDAMDLMYNNSQLDGFCLVSSCSDLSRLAQRLRERGLVVYGFGDRNTPETFRNSCTKFTYMAELDSNKQKPPPKKAASLLSKAIGTPRLRSGWIHISTASKRIREEHPDFRPTNYEGCSSMTELFQKAGGFQTKIDGFVAMVRRKP